MTDERALVLTAATALLGRDLTPVRDAVVIVRGRRIETAGSRSAVSIPDGADVFETPGGTLIPGFIDSHVHIGFADPAEVLRRGVTTVRDLGWPSDRIYPAARRSRQEGSEGPLILMAGPMITVDRGYPLTASWAPPGTGIPVRSPTEARRVVATLADDGVDVIKVSLNPPAGRVLDAGMVDAIVREAHALGLRVTGHIHGLKELHKALDAGIDELAHMLMGGERIPDETIGRMVDGGVSVVPTLSIFSRGAARTAVEELDRFVAAGGNVVYGTDLGNAGPKPGIDDLEVGRMEEAGMTWSDIVRSATTGAAGWLGLDTKGALEPGMDADIVCLESEIGRASDLTKVVRVLREGRVAA